ncbi:hypothetical protein CI789_05820 [Erwinia persicina]|nr:hypothetical protein CI789_05820 [Erwinia persicina]
MALDWHKSSRTWSENHAARLLASMNNHIFQIIGHLSVTELKTRHFCSGSQNQDTGIACFHRSSYTQGGTPPLFM